MVASPEIIQLAEQTAKLCQQSDTKRDFGLPTQIDTVQRFDNLCYGSDPQWQILDIYRPKSYQGKVPTIINFHGGGFVYGTKETYQFYGMSLAEQDFAFVNITYRLAPQVEFPSELDDIHLAIRWVTQHAEEYQLDMDNVFFIGDSAGAQMALQYTTIVSNEQFRQLFGYEQPALQLRATAINCGAYFIDMPNVISGVLSAYFTEESLQQKHELLRTEAYLTPDVPPLFVMTSSHDFIRDHSLQLHGYLLAKNITHEFRSYGSLDNPKAHVFHCDIRDTEAQKCNEDELNFFRQYLHQ